MKLFKWVLFVVYFVILSLSLSSNLIAQLISIKSVPIASGNQFLLFPSQNLGMANVSIALDDPSLDPFINPAKGSRIKGIYLFSSPASYSISDGLGSGRVFPLAILYGNRKRFGGLYLAGQQLQPAHRNTFHVLNDRSSGNMYALGMFGTKLNRNNSIAGRIFWADLNAVEGVDLLYWNSQDIKQSGEMIDFRVGLLSELKGDRSFEALLIYNRLNMTHDVSYRDFELNEKNYDRSRTVGIHLGYVEPIPNSYWRLGSIFSANLKTHPKIPNYEIMNIQRDPGKSFAMNMGLGLSRIYKGGSIGLDFVYEPIWSNTWADAVEDITTPNGHIIQPGHKIIENHFRFHDWILRIGVTGLDKHFGFQMGLQFYSIGYDLEQINYVEEQKRKQHERWDEWTAHWGLMLILKNIKIIYQVQITNVTLRQPDFGNSNGLNVLSVDYIPAPRRSIQFSDTQVVAHQITLSIPISR